LTCEKIREGGQAKGMCCQGLKHGGISRAALAEGCRTAPARKQADSARDSGELQANGKQEALKRSPVMVLTAQADPQ